jgi:prolyl-tRNA editing enzyme YbaK/EbsC (Cys-tRNA(Pro) deacylase)
MLLAVRIANFVQRIISSLHGDFSATLRPMTSLFGPLFLLILCSYSWDLCWGFIPRYSVATSTTCSIASDQYHYHQHQRSLTRCWGNTINGNTTTTTAAATSSSSSSTARMPPQTPPIRMSDIGSFDSATNDVSESTSQAMAHLLETVAAIQSEHDDAIQILPHSELRSMTSPNNNNNNLRDINSIVFTVERRRTNYNNDGETTTSSTDYVLAILDSMDRVNVTRLEQAVVAATISIDGDEGRDVLSLAPNEKLAQICGFVTGTVPPLGLQPAPLLTVVEASLLFTLEDKNSTPPLLVGGGGQPGISTLLPLQTLLDRIPKVYVAHFRLESSSSSLSNEPVKAKRSAVRAIKSNKSWGRSLVGYENERYQKPFFAIAPPDTEVARQIVAIPSTVNGDPSSQESSIPLLQPEFVAVVGRISGVRQMARRLMFVDLAPPIGAGALDNEEEDIHPWRSPTTGQNMAVQLIVGKTYCQQFGAMEEAELAMRKLKFGQLVMVQGKTNVGTRDSLKNWIAKTSLDIVAFDIQQLQLEASAAAVAEYEEGKDNRRTTKSASTASKKYRRPTSAITTTTLNPNLAFLQLQDLYPHATLEKAVRIIDDLQGVQDVQSKLDTWLEAHPNQVGLVGMDCEWKPNFLAGGESQPVLLLQLCIHPLQEIYLVDLQTLVRPLCQPTESMTDVEAAFAQLMHRLYKTPTLVKVGFQVTNDLQRLAASYRHIAPLRSNITSVLELSRLGMKVLQLTRQPNSRVVTASLAKMVEHFVERNLNKNEQVSDWSQRPLSPEQKEYAALDAVVTPYIVERLLEAVGASFVAPSSSLQSSSTSSAVLSSTTVPPRMERWGNDATFVPYFQCFRFLLLNETERLAIRRWKAKRVVGDDSYYLVSQTWIAGQNVPNLPFIPDDGSFDGPYSDVQGIVRVPCHGVTLADDTKDQMLDSMLGCWSANTKDGCLVDLLDLQGDSNNNILGNTIKGANLDFNRRSGFVELANAVVLFVNLPARGDGRGQSRSYPNEWLEDGSILSWFVKENDWQGGSTKLAQKMTTGNPTVVLFVRRGKGPFFCCSRCKVVTTWGDRDKQQQQGGDSDQWSIVKLFLLLTDFDKLQSVPAFQKLVHPAHATTSTTIES